jgi:acetylornithine deacetylase
MTAAGSGSSLPNQAMTSVEPRQVVSSSWLRTMWIGRLARAYEEGPLDPRFTPPYSTLHVGTIRGGTARNILARECVFHWEFRGLPGAATALAAAKVQAFVDEVATPRLARFVSDPSILTTMEVDVPPLAAEPGSAAEAFALRLTRSNRTIAVSFATEAGHFQAARLPTVVCGPGSIDQAHKADEFVDEAQLAACLEFLEGLAEDLAR